MFFAKTVIAVDDDQLVLDFLQVICESKGAEFHGVTGGQACLDVMQDVKPDLILLDVNMPEMDGIQTMDKIKQIFPNSSAPIVFLSARSDVDTITSATAKGGVAYILKPIEADRLIDKIQSVVNSAQQSKSA